VSTGGLGWVGVPPSPTHTPFDYLILCNLLVRLTVVICEYWDEWHQVVRFSCDCESVILILIKYRPSVGLELARHCVVHKKYRSRNVFDWMLEIVIIVVSWARSVSLFRDVYMYDDFPNINSWILYQAKTLKLEDISGSFLPRDAYA